MEPTRWERVARRVYAVVEAGLCAIAPFPRVPWPDLPAQGWTVDADGRPVSIPAPMDGGPVTGGRG